MVDMNTLLSLQITIFLLVLAGYIMTKMSILPPSVRGPLSDLVIDFILPCNIIVSFLLEFNKEILQACLTILAVSICIQIFTIVAGDKFYSKKNPGEHTVLKYATIVSNAGFLGNPIAQGLYGETGLLYASVYLIPVRIFMWSAGIACFTGTKGKGVMKKVLTHPCIVAVIIGMVLMILQIPLPAGLEKTLRTAGNCNTALCMIVIGNILAEIRIRDVFSKKTFWYSAVRLLIIPTIVFAGCRAAKLDAVVTGVSTVLAGMPAPASGVILAAKYHGEEHFAVKIVFLSTVLSLITVPLLCVMMTAFQGNMTVG